MAIARSTPAIRFAGITRTIVDPIGWRRQLNPLRKVPTPTRHRRV
jgi:hypothetical protein